MPDPMETINQAMLAQQALTESMEHFVDDADRQVGEVAARHSEISAKVYVDQALGNDSNAGTRGAPVQTLQRAVNLGAANQLINIYLRGNYATTRRYQPNGRKIRIFGAVGDDWRVGISESERSTITATFSTYQRGADLGVRVNGFDIGLGASWNIENYDIILPSEAEITAAHPTALSSDYHRALFPVQDSAHAPAGAAMLRYGTLTIPADGYVNMLGPRTGATFEAVGLAVIGSLSGRIHPRASAGTLAINAPYINTNLETL